MPETTLLTHLLTGARQRLRDLRTNDAGNLTTEQVIWIAVIAALAITILGIVAAKITAKANSINLG